MARQTTRSGIGEFGGGPSQTDWGGSATAMPLYWLFEASQASLVPARAFADAGRLVLKNPFNPLSHTDWGRKLGAMCEVFERATRRYGKPAFGVGSTLVRGERVPVTERTVWSRPFCDLVHFERGAGRNLRKQPKLLIVAPMSGHYATLLRGTVEAMLPDHDVYVTDWTDARLVPLSEGPFDLDDYIDYLISIFQFLEGECHIMAVCQPAVPVLAAVARMEAQDDPFVPRSMTLMGGPIDTRINPTAVNELAVERGTEWFQKNVVTVVPWPHAGAMRPVYPGFLQLTGFVTMNLDRHVSAHNDFFKHLVDGDGDSAEKHREFYDEYLAVMDLTAEFYLQTVDTVFVRHALPKGEMTHRGKPVDCSKIRRCALMTVEGEKDDISGVGQTRAAHDLCSSLPDDMRVHYLQLRVGHYGVFNGSRFRAEIATRIHDFVLTHEPRAAKSGAKAPVVRPEESDGVSAAEEVPAIAPIVEATPAAAQRMAVSAPSTAKKAPAPRKPATAKPALPVSPRATQTGAKSPPAKSRSVTSAPAKSTPVKPPKASAAAAKARSSKVRPSTDKSSGGRAGSNGKPDDLTRIVGVGPKIQTLLNEAGIFRFTQIAGLSAGEIKSLDDKVTPPGRVTRDKWVEQAVRLSTTP